MNSSNWLWIAFLLLWITGSAWWHVCKIKLICNEPPQPVSQATSPAVPSLQLVDDAALILTVPGNFSFARSGYHPTFPASRIEIDSVAAYLLSAPEKRLILTGFYDEQELNTSGSPNLGTARAEEIKAYYLTKGVADARIVTRGKLNDELVFTRDSLYGGIAYEFIDALTLIENNLAEEQKFETIFKPLDLYFNTGSTFYIQTPDNERFLEEAKLFLAENEDRKIMLTGHTDNVGDAASNLELSKERAESVKQALVEAGINPEQLIVDAKGQTEPKADNATTEGQAANRRVTIVVSESQKQAN